MIEKMKNFLLINMVNAQLVSGGKEIVCRCPECGDSVNPTSKHFYIGIPTEGSNNPFFYDCKKASCQAHGIVTYNKLMEWGLFDQELNIELSTYNKRVLSLEVNRKFRDRPVYKIYNTFISDNKLSQAKLKYLNKRLGTNLTYNDLLENKIVLNLKDLLYSNNITKYTRYESVVNELDESFIGFISYDNSFVNMRNLREGKLINKNIDKKYVNYNIFDRCDNTKRFYTLPTDIDLCNPNRIRLNVMEGPLDALSIYYNLLKTKQHTIYAAACGGGYAGLVRNFIVNLKLINLEVHVYVDNNISNQYIINSICNVVYIFKIPVYIHRNIYIDEKDFGVPLNRINELVYRIS